MPSHPPRPHEGTGSANWGGTAGSAGTHPPRPFGTAGNPLNADIGHGKTGQKTPLGPMPTRSPPMSDVPGEVE